MINRDRRGAWFGVLFLGLLALMLYQGARILAPLLGPLVLASVLAVMFYPVHQWLGRWVKVPSVRALVSDGLVLAFFVVPLILLASATLSESSRIIPLFQKALEKGPLWVDLGFQWIESVLQYLPSWMVDRFNIRADSLRDQWAMCGSQSIGPLAQVGAQVTRHLVRLAGQLVLVVFTLFFFFRDGERYVRRLQELLPLEAPAKARLEEKVYGTIVGVFRGAFLIAVVHGVVASTGLLIVRAHPFFLLAGLSFLAAVIPVIGTTLVWGPLSLHYFLTGSYVKAVFLVVWGAVAIGPLDSLLRPWVVSANAKVPFFWLFLGMLGGAQVFGPSGILVGPLVIGILPILFDIYRTSYLGEV